MTQRVETNEPVEGTGEAQDFSIGGSPSDELQLKQEVGLCNKTNSY